MSSMCPEEVREIVRETVSQTLEGLGLDTSKPEELRRDFVHLRNWRETTQAVQRHGIFTAVGILVAGLAAAAWLGLQYLLGSKQP